MQMVLRVSFRAIQQGLDVRGLTSWANRNNFPQFFPGHKSVTTWKSYSSGLSKGLTNFKAGAKVLWSQAFL